MRKNRFGLSIALSTPFTEERAIDLSRLVAHVGEGPSIGLRRSDPVAWSRMRAPLASLSEADVRKLGAAIDAIRGKRAA